LRTADFDLRCYVPFKATTPPRAVALLIYGADDLLPGTVDAAAAAQALAIERHARGRAVVLIGYSTGGLLAWATVGQCARRGILPSGVVLIDTRAPEVMLDLLEPVLHRMLQPDRAHPDLTEERLTAMAAYLRLLRDWRPTTLAVPTLLVSAAEPINGADDAAPKHDNSSIWSTRIDTVIVPGSHLTILEEHVEGRRKRLTPG
jgi:polyketide synthase 7